MKVMFFEICKKRKIRILKHWLRASIPSRYVIKPLLSTQQKSSTSLRWLG